MTDSNGTRQNAAEANAFSAMRAVSTEVAKRYGMEAAAFEQTVFETCCDTQLTRAEFAAFLLIAKEYHLNPITREIYAFKKREGGGIVPIVSVDGWISLVNSHPQFDGMEFDVREDGDKLVSVTCRLYRKDRSRPVEVTEYYEECRRDTGPWKMKHRMLRHKALIQCARYAFGFSGIYDEEEGAVIAGGLKDITPVPPPPPPPTEEPKENGQDKPQVKAAPKPKRQKGEPRTNKTAYTEMAAEEPKQPIEEAVIVEELMSNQEFQEAHADYQSRYAGVQDREALEELKAEAEGLADRLLPTDLIKLRKLYEEALERL